ncbi:MAG: hypothetical protein ACLT16_14600 [[Clostridium] innocuum]
MTRHWKGLENESKGIKQGGASKRKGAAARNRGESHFSSGGIESWDARIAFDEVLHAPGMHHPQDILEWVNQQIGFEQRTFSRIVPQSEKSADRQPRDVVGTLTNAVCIREISGAMRLLRKSMCPQPSVR